MLKGEDLVGNNSRNQEFLTQLSKSKQLAQEIISENQELKLEITHLQQQLAEKNNYSDHLLLQENQKLLQQIRDLEDCKSSTEKENRAFFQRYAEVEKQNEALTNLYVASHQLHSTLETQKVVDTIIEIILNLIGAEEFAIFMLNEVATELVYLGGELSNQQLYKKKISLGEGIEGIVALSRTPYRRITETESVISIPLEITLPAKSGKQAINQLVGVISIYKLLAHKKDFTDLDYELLNLLAGQAATALLSSRLYHITERKLKTIEGLMTLLRNP